MILVALFGALALSVGAFAYPVVVGGHVPSFVNLPAPAASHPTNGDDNGTAPSDNDTDNQTAPTSEPSDANDTEANDTDMNEMENETGDNSTNLSDSSLAMSVVFNPFLASVEQFATASVTTLVKAVATLEVHGFAPLTISL